MKKKLLVSLSLAAVGCICLLGAALMVDDQQTMRMWFYGYALFLGGMIILGDYAM